MNLEKMISCLLLFLLASGASAAERVVSFDVDGQKVVGTLNLPNDIAKPPVVLLLHGFTETRDAFRIQSVNEGIYARAARLWATKGIASLRIDFRGSGDSDGEFADTTVDGQIKDALAALDYLQGNAEVDNHRIAIVGWSLGGAVGATVAARTKYELDAVVLWAPVTNMVGTMSFILGEEAMEEGLVNGAEEIEVKLPWGATTYLNGPFFRSVHTVDPVADIRGFTNPLLVAVGTKDAVVFPQPRSGQVLLDAHEGAEELIVWEMDHVFNVLENTETVDRLINKTGEFITHHFD